MQQSLSYKGANMYIDIDVIFYAIMTGCVIVFIIGLVYGFDGQEKKNEQD